jgi:peptidoglycan/xylan/chitin deacetylase (PgdA/CDA1 family)
MLKSAASPDRWRVRLARGAGVILAALVAACASTPPTAPVVPVAVAPGAGQVLGRDERFIVYDPGPADTLASLALRFLGDADRRWSIADFNEIDHVQVGKPVVIPLVPINPLAVQAHEYQTVPILCYHRFGGTKNRMIVSPAQFAAQLDWLAANDYRVIPLKQLIGFFAGTESIPKRAVVITIDDGHESAYQYAVPLLRKHGFPATFFIYTDFIGAGSALTWPQLRELAASGEFDIGAHSKTHRNLVVRAPGENDTIYRKNIDIEVHASLDLLARQLQEPIDTFAFPYGDSNDLILTTLDQAKVRLAASVTPGSNPFFAQPNYLRRTMIFGEYDLETFKSKVQTSRRLDS